MTFTVLGASGFIGSRVAAHLAARGAEVYAPSRGDPGLFARPLGTVIYCIGLTADFRGRPLPTVEAHVCRLREILERADFASLTYLSSTRVYRGCRAATEDSPLTLSPADPDDLYNVSKVMGESLCLSSGRPVRIVRLSNVYGPDLRSPNFLCALLRDAITRRRLAIKSAPDSAKDYVDVDDAVPMLVRIAEAGAGRIYNLASGRNTVTRDLADAIARATGCAVEFRGAAAPVVFPPIAIARLREEFGFRPGHVLDRLPGLVARIKEAMSPA